MPVHRMPVQTKKMLEPQNHAACWQDILVLSRAMQKHARQGEWEKVIQSEAERQSLITAYFSEQSQTGNEQALAEGIQEILDMDIEIMELGKRNRDDLSKEIRNLQTGRKASQVYAGHTS